MILDKSNQKGMSLVEMVILLIVVSVLALPFIQEYRDYASARAVGLTTDNMAIVNDAITAYLENNRTFPCPDRKVGLPQDAVNFGTQDCPTPGEIANPAILVMRGFVPVKDLGLEEKYALDGWNRRLTYIISKKLLPPFDISTATSVEGVMDEYYIEYDENDPTAVQKQAPHIMVESTNPGEAVRFQNRVGYLISHGETGRGAYNINGIQVEACPAPSDALDHENCDDDKKVYSNRAGQEKTSLEGIDFYDDIVEPVIAADSSKTWTFSQANIDDSYSGFDQIGINETDPMADLIDDGSGTRKVGIDVDGNILVEQDGLNRNGQTLSEQVCDETGDDTVTGGHDYCFNPRIIAGDVSTCGDNAIVGIANNQVYCLDYVPLNAKSCGAGEYVISVDSSGNVTCGAP